MIKVGDTLPETTFTVTEGDKLVKRTTKEIFSGHKVVLVGLPGAFTPVCSSRHVPGFIELADKIKAQGIDTIAILSVNDGYVMRAWEKTMPNDGKVLFLADGNAEFTKTTGLTHDGTEGGMGLRAGRYAMIVEDGVVKTLNLEDTAFLDASSAETILSLL